MKENARTPLVGFKLAWPLWIAVWRINKQTNKKKNLKIELLFDPAILLLDIYSEKKNEYNNSKRYMHPMFA